MRAALAAHDEVLRSAIETHGGYMFKHTGDGVWAAFSSPRSAANAAITARRDLELPGIGDPDVVLPEIDPDACRRRLTALVNSASLARNTPALYVIEDAHWIDEVSEPMPGPRNHRAERTAAAYSLANTAC